MRSFALSLLAAALVPGAALAQTSEASGVAPVQAPHGEAAMRLLLQEIQAERMKVNACYQLGCLIIVNDTRSYDVIGFYLARNTSGGQISWGRNAFSGRLLPRKMAIRPKTGGADTCAVPVRFVLRHQRTRQQLELEGSASLCMSPHVDSMLHLKMPEGRVIVEESNL